MSVIITASLGDGHLTRRNREIEHLEISSKLGEPHRCTIRFDLDTNFSDSLQDYHGAMAVTIANEDGSDPTVLFEGVMTGGTQDHQLRGGSRFEVRGASPALLAMAHQTDPSQFSRDWDGTMAALGVQVKGSPRYSVPKGGYRMFGGTRLEYLRRAADDAGFFVLERDGQVELHSEFIDDNRRELTWGRHLLALRARSELVNHRFRGGVYEIMQKADYRFRDQQKAPVVTGALALAGAVKAAAPAFATPGDPNFALSDSRATSRPIFRDALLRESERTLGGAVVVEGESLDFMLRLGETIQTIDAPDFPLPGSVGVFGVVELSHVWNAAEYRNHFSASPWKNFSNFARPALEITPGPFLAEVLKTDAGSLAKGFLSVRLAASMSVDPSYVLLARLVTPFAGNARGLVLVPEPGDEVLVDFAQGDPEHAYVVGSVWNPKDACPGIEPKQLVTKAGNVLALHDDGWIELYTPEGKCMLQMSSKDNPPRVTLHSEGDLILEAKGEIQLRAASLHEHISGGVQRKIGGDVDVKIGGSLNCKVDSNVSHEGATVVMKGGGGKLSLTESASLLSGTMAVISGSGTAIVTGGMVQLNPPVVPPEIPIVAMPPQLPGELKSSWAKRAVPPATPPFDSGEDPAPSGS